MKRLVLCKNAPNVIDELVVLMDQVRRRKIRIIDNLYVMKLLKSGDLGRGEEVKIIRALCIDIKKKWAITFKSNSVILAAGGYSRVYTPSSSRIFENYGEGVALAYDVGADLIDMEIAYALNTVHT